MATVNLATETALVSFDPGLRELVDHGPLNRETWARARMMDRFALRIPATVAQAMTTAYTAADQYIAIVLPGRMFKAEFKRRKLAPENLSRVIEDSGTLTSPLIPWNTCGAYMSATLGVATFAYLPFAFFNLINPVLTVIYGFTGFSIKKLDDAADEQLA